MATVTQQIPNYILGISEQPDELKSAGQVNDLVNAIPDVTRGLMKRPGSKLIKNITVPNETLSWFSIYTDENDQYIGNVNTDGNIQLWRTRDGFSYHDNNGEGTNLIVYKNDDANGLPNVSNNAQTYLSGWTEESQLQALTLNEQTFITNRTKQTAMKTGTSDKSPALVNEAIIEIDVVSYGKQYALNIYDPSNPGTPISETRATSIAAKNDFVRNKNNATQVGNGSCDRMTRENIIADNIYDSSSDSYVGSGTNRNNFRYEIDVRCVPVVDPDNIGDSSSGPQYNDAYQPIATLQFGGEGWQTGDETQYITTKNSKGSVKVKSHVTTTCFANIAKVRPPATSSSQDETISAAGILGSMKTTLDAISGTGITATITGNCLHLKRSTPFAISTPEPQLMTIITNECNDVSELPTNCRHNYVVKVVNSSEDEDDFYLKFKQSNAGTTANTDYFGEGVWEECPAPGIEIAIDEDTMPIKIVRENAGTTYPQGRFRVQTIDYKTRGVGDDNTNPVPSFIGSTLEKMMFFRNRLVVLSKGNVILSKTNDFFNFFSTTAMSESTADPIDLQASSTFPTTLHDGIEVNAGLLLFSSNQQFMLTTDSDALTPSTAKINYLASYNYNPKTVPFSLGTTSGFINSTGKNARIFEMANVQREGEPVVLEQSKLVSKLLTINLVKPTTSKENSLLLLAGYSPYVWGFRFYNNGEKRVQSAWFKWLFAGIVLHHVMFDDTYYMIQQSRDEDNPTWTLESIDIKTQNDTIELSQQDVFDNYRDYPIYLDAHTEISALPASAYNATTGKTTFTKPAGFNVDFESAILDRNPGDNFGSYATYGEDNSSNNTVSFNGNWTGRNLIFGYMYAFQIDIPKIFVTQAAGEKSRADTRGSLILHRLHFNFSELGECQVGMRRIGRPADGLVIKAAELDSYKLNTYPVVRDYIQTIPIYERNTNLDLYFVSYDPVPLILNSMTWEGDYNPKYYRRV